MINPATKEKIKAVAISIIVALFGIGVGDMVYDNWDIQYQTPVKIVPRRHQIPKGESLTPTPTIPSPTPTIVSKLVTYYKNSRCMKARMYLGLNTPKHIKTAVFDIFGNQASYALELICRESSFNEFAINPTSGACGLSQALPCEKMKCELSDTLCQLKWISKYVNRRYGTVKEALAYHDLVNWY